MSHHRQAQPFRSGLAEMKRLMCQRLEGTLTAGSHRKEEVVVAAMMADANVKEGLAAFRARREPKVTK